MPPDLTYPEGWAREDMNAAGCYSLIASFLGAPDGTDLRRRVGWFAGDFGPDAWVLGNHGVVCFLGTDAPTRSLKGTGLPGR
jgi:hypothetical protein